MKNLKFLGLCLACFIVCARVSAQNKVPINEPDLKKPRLFAELPDRIALNITEVQNLFAGTTGSGKQVRIGLGDRQTAGLNGTIISDDSKYNNTIRTLIIRSTNFSGATLTLSSFTQPDGTVVYSGRIISFKHADLYELEKQNDQYVWVKKNFNDLVNE